MDRASLSRTTRAGAADGRLHLYAIGLGSNRPMARQLGPRAIVHAAMIALDLPPLSVIARSRVITSRPIGPSRRSYANAAVLVASPLSPEVMLDRLHAIEARFRRRRHRRWGDRTLDLDLLLWSGGRVGTRRLTVPHSAFAQRGFVLEPLKEIVPRWRDPVTGLSIAQLTARLAKPKAVRPKAC